MSQDPMGFDAGDSNLYRYVHNAPTNYDDPSGYAELTPGQSQQLEKVFALIEKSLSQLNDDLEKHLKKITAKDYKYGSLDLHFLTKP